MAFSLASNNLRVSHLFEPSPPSLPPTASIKQAAELMQGLTQALVWVLEGQTCLGFLTEQEIFAAIVAGVDLAHTPVFRYMVAQFKPIPASMGAVQALTQLQQQAAFHLPVIDHQGHLIGLVTQQRLYQAVFGAASACTDTLEPSLVKTCTPSPQVDHAQIESALRASEARFRAIFEQANVGICLADEAGYMLKANPGLCKLVGYAPEELAQMTFAEITHPDDIGADIAQYQQLLARQLSSFSMEKRYVHRQGHEIWVNLTVCLVHDPEGQLLFSIGVSQDISDRKAAEIALRQSQERLALATHESQVGVWDWNLTTDEVYVSPNLKAILGYRDEEVPNHLNSWNQLVHPEDQPQVSKAVQAHLDGLTPHFNLTYRMMHKDGSLRWILARGGIIQDAMGRPVRMAGTDTDITELKYAEEALLQSHRQVVSILESITDAFYALDQQWRLTYVNQRAEQLLQRSREELLGRDFWAVFPDAVDTPFYSEYQRAMLEQVSLTFEAYYPPYETWFEVHVYPSQDGLSVYFQDITDHKRTNEQLQRQALHDALTGVPNRTFFMQRLNHAIAQLQSHPDSAFAVLFIDLDRFKVINDSLGHLVGDRLLIECTQRLQAVVRANDLVARLGGDEFAILLTEIADLDQALEVAARIHDTMRQPFNLKGREIFVSASIGISSNLTGSVEAVDFLRDADTAMYRAKDQGRNCSAIFDPVLHEQVNRQLTLENDLRRALERNELELHYQPIFDLPSQRLIGFEALLRWQHSQWGYISPATFIPLAEETGLILPIGTWTLQTASQQLKQWQETLPQAAALMMSVNLSVKQFASTRLIRDVDETLAATGLASSRLRLEITESALIDHPETAESILAAIRERGIQLCIDDFGTGYSSLSLVHRFPVHILKIDRSFVSHMEADARGVAMVQAVLALAKSLGMAAIAEGVETAAQVACLQTLGCPYAQGFWLAKPMSAVDAQAFISRFTSE